MEAALLVARLWARAEFTEKAVRRLEGELETLAEDAPARVTLLEELARILEGDLMPESAARAFMHRVRHRRNQVLLMETPPASLERFVPAAEAARLVLDRALMEGREVLSEPESKAILSSYGVPVVETRIVA